MSDLMYRNLPRNVRERFDAISQVDVDRDPAVVEALAQVRHVEQRFQDWRAGLGEQQARVASVGAAIEQLAVEIATIDGDRSNLAANVVLGTASDAEDRKAQARRADLVRQKELWQLGLASARSELARRSTNPYGPPAVRASETLEAARFAARVALAEQAASR